MPTQCLLPSSGQHNPPARSSASRIKTAKCLVGPLGFIRCHSRQGRENVSMDAHLGAPGKPFATFCFGPEDGNLVDHLVGECSLGLVAVLFGPAFLGPVSGLLVADPSQ